MNDTYARVVAEAAAKPRRVCFDFTREVWLEVTHGLNYLADARATPAADRPRYAMAARVIGLRALACEPGKNVKWGLHPDAAALVRAGLAAIRA